MSTGGARSRARGTVDIGRPPRGRVELGLRTRVIAPLTSGSRGGLLDEAAAVGDEPVDLVEWRADSMVRALAGSSFAAAPDLVGELTATAGALLGASALPLIATVRTSSEGGAAHLDDSEYCALVASLAGMADAVDVEIGREGAPDLVRAPRGRGGGEGCGTSRGSLYDCHRALVQSPRHPGRNSMKAPHTDQLELLTLLGYDQRESVLRHKRESHPAHAVVREFAGRAQDLQRAAVKQSAVISDAGREVARIEAEIARVRERRQRQQGRIDANQVPLRDISAMQHEIAQMDRRLGELEDDQLAAEERVESARSAQRAMEEESAAIMADVEEHKAQFLADTAATDDELRQVIRARRELVARLDADLVEEYEDAKRRNGVLAVIEVRDGVGVGVGADLSPLELDRIMRTPADEVYRTEDTQQIVVRTTASTPR